MKKILLCFVATGFASVSLMAGDGQECPLAKAKAATDKTAACQVKAAGCTGGKAVASEATAKTGPATAAVSSEKAAACGDTAACAEKTACADKAQKVSKILHSPRGAQLARR